MANRPPPTPVARPSAAPPDAASETDDQTGFDLYVSQPGVTTWHFDGELVTTRLPARIRAISTGPHEIEIDGPPGFANVVKTVVVERGKAPKVEIELPPKP